MYMIRVTRVVKKNTNSTEKFSPRTANHETKHFCGPFRTLKAAERTMCAILATHTCIDAIIWTEEQIRNATSSDKAFDYGNSFGLALKALDALKPSDPVAV